MEAIWLGCSLFVVFVRRDMDSEWNLVTMGKFDALPIGQVLDPSSLGLRKLYALSTKLVRNNVIAKVISMCSSPVIVK